MMQKDLRNMTIGLLLGVGSLYAIAAVSVPNTFTANTAIKSAEVNANFIALQTGMNTLETGLGGKQARVTGVCDTGKAMKEVKVDGTVTCEAVGTGGSVGPAGPKGDAGVQGPAGAKGDTGAQGPVGPGVKASFYHVAQVSNLAGGVNGNIIGDRTCFSNSFSNFNTSALISVTPAYGTGVYNPNPIGIVYDIGRNEWCVFNSNNAAMPDQTAFNIFIY